VAIANVLQLEAAWRHASPFLLKLWCHAKFEVAECIIAFLLPIHYFMLIPWPLTPWPWPLILTFAVYRLLRDETVNQIWTQSSNPWWSYWEL